MSDHLVLKVIAGKKISERDVWNELYEICEDTHSSCDSSCPVYRLNGDEFPSSSESEDDCFCFKNGRKMREFIESKMAVLLKELE